MSASCGDWLACANTLSADCCNIWFLVNSALSAAISRSLILAFVDFKFSIDTDKLSIVDSSLFCNAPKWDLFPDTLVIASSIFSKKALHAVPLDSAPPVPALIMLMSWVNPNASQLEVVNTGVTSEHLYLS